MASSFFCIFAFQKSIQMQQGNKTQARNGFICGNANANKGNAICGDANYDNEKPTFEDTNVDNDLYFDENDFENFDWGTHLPHWHQNGKYVFVTFRLRDSIPQEKLQRLYEEKENWLKHHPQPWDEKTTKEYINKFGKAIDKWMDNNFGECLLKETNNRKVVEDALFFFDGKRYDLIAFVVMPNHVHLLIKLKEGYGLVDIMRSIKSFTAKKINENENRVGPVWQSESYDRLIRDQKHFEIVVRYIIANNKDLAWVKSSIVADCGT